MSSLLHPPLGDVAPQCPFFREKRGLCTNRALTSLDLAANELDEYAGQELAHSLVKNKTLTDIDLTGNNVPDEWLREHHKASDNQEAGMGGDRVGLLWAEETDARRAALVVDLC